jgi:hypothetical protein
MKTITEFSGFTLKEAITKKAALLAEGKTEEESQAAVNEILKLDEAKAPFYKIAVDMTGSRIDRVKRVVVATKANDAEKVPDAFMEREGHFYLVEFFPQAHERGPKKEESASYHDDFARGRTGPARGRGGPGGGGGSDRGRGRGDRDRNAGGGGGFGGDRGPGGGGGFGGDRGPGGGGGRGRGPGGDRPARGPGEQRPSSGVRFDGAPHTPMPANNDKGGGRPPRGPRPPKQEGAGGGERKPRPPREPGQNRGPRGAGELRLVLKGQTTTLQGSGPATPPPAADTAPQASTPAAE